MDDHTLKIVGLLAVLFLVFIVGAAAGGGAVFALTRTRSLDLEQEAMSHQLDSGPGVAISGPDVVVSEPEVFTSEPGVVITAVATDSPAAQAGLKRGDILLKINGQTVNNPEDMLRYLRDLKSGDQVELTVLRGGEERRLMAILGERAGQSYLGVSSSGGLAQEPAPVYSDMAHFGTRIIEVVPGSPADKAGLKAGDLIVAVDGQKLDAEHSLTDLTAQRAPGDSVTLEVISPNQESREVTVQLGENPEEAGAAYLGVKYEPAPGIPPVENKPLDKPILEMHPLQERGGLIFPGGGVEQGVVVRRVMEDSPAEAAGLEPGDIIIAIDGEPVDGPQALADAIARHKPGDVLNLAVYHPQGGETFQIEVTLAEHPDKAGEAYLGVVS